MKLLAFVAGFVAGVITCCYLVGKGTHLDVAAVRR